MARKIIHPKKRKLNKPSLYLALILILLGTGLIFFSANTQSKVEPVPQSAQTEKPKDYPVKLYIPKLKKALEISAGQVVNNRWTVSDTGVSYLTTSALPGSIGNSVIYGHNKKEILGFLPTLSIGDRIYITTENGEIIIYEVFEKKEIKPTQVEILNNTADSRLTIYTCSGFLDQSRYVVIAEQIST